MGLKVKDIRSAFKSGNAAKAASAAEAKATNRKVDNGFKIIDLLLKAVPGLTESGVKIQGALDASRKVASETWINGQKLLSEETRNQLAIRGQEAAINGVGAVYRTLENTFISFTAVELLNRTSIAERRAELIASGKFDSEIGLHGVVYYKEYTAADETEAPAVAEPVPAEATEEVDLSADDATPDEATPEEDAKTLLVEALVKCKTENWSTEDVLSYIDKSL